MVPLNMFKPSSDFTDRCKVMCFSCGSFFVIYVSSLSLLFCLVCYVQPCDLALLCVKFLVFLHLSHMVSRVRCGT